MFLESITGDIISRALDVSSYNHQLIATNIANVGVKGYRGGHIKFDAIMQDLRNNIRSNASDDEIKISLDQIKDNLSASTMIDANDVSIDTEMINLTENTLRYQALLRARTELGEILKTAISGGARG